MKPIVKINKKNIIDKKPVIPINLRETAQGNKKATSKSKKKMFLKDKSYERQ